MKKIYFYGSPAQLRAFLHNCAIYEQAMSNTNARHRFALCGMYPPYGYENHQ